VIAGRRAGKSRIAALLAVYVAAFRDHRPDSRRVRKPERFVSQEAVTACTVSGRFELAPLTGTSPACVRLDHIAMP